MTQQTKLVKIYFLSFFSILLIAFAIFNSRALIAGPYLKISSPTNGQSTDHPFVEIKGNSQNTSFISLNDRSIFIDPKGDFKEGYLLSTGNNIIVLKARDRFGREIEKRLELVFRES